MKDDELRQIVAGTNTAILTAIALLADEMERQGVFQAQPFKERLEALLSPPMPASDRIPQLQAETTVTQLRSLLRMLAVQPGPRWTPSIVPKGDPE